ARAHGVDAVDVGHHGDLRAPPGLAGDAADLHQAVGDLGHLELEEALDELVRAAAHDDLWALGGGTGVDDHGLHPRAVVVALARHLLALGQEGLHAAEVHERVAVVGLLDDARHDVAHAVDVLLEHHLALGLADPLQHHLLGRLRSDAPEVVGRYVDGLDLTLVVGAPVDVRRGRLPLGRVHGVGDRGLRLRQRAELLALRQDELEDAHLARLPIDLDARELRGVGGLLVGRQEGVLERHEQGLRADPLLALDLLDGLDDLAIHVPLPAWPARTLARRTSDIGTRTTPSVEASVSASASAATTVPVRDRRPSGVGTASRTCTRRPTARWKCSTVRSGGSGPGEDTSTA